MKTKLHGVLVALVTPMKANEDIDCGKLGGFTDHLIRKGVHGIIPLGSTGEYYALSAAERESVLRTVLEAAAVACRSSRAPTPAPRARSSPTLARPSSLAARA